MRFFAIILGGVCLSAFLPNNRAQELEQKPSDPYFGKFHPKKAPPSPAKLLLKEGDRLAICGDSITEQKMYSRLMEIYLTVARPELNISVRQYGWSGETAQGFLARMTNDCLRFKPTVATTCYGMNDHGYRAYEPEIGKRYEDTMAKIIDDFKAAGVRVILGSPGCVGKVPSWTRSGNATKEELNLNLCELRNLDIDLAAREEVPFADIFWPMLVAEHQARQQIGPDFAVPGKDGVHPGWAGQVMMAYEFLKAMGLDGEIGTFTIDLQNKTATVSKGHNLDSLQGTQLKITSRRYPICAQGETNRDDSMRAGMQLVPFNQDLNRLMLVVKNAGAKRYKVTWGDTTRELNGERLEKGVNLVEEFPLNPFSDAYAKVDAAIMAKQAYETREIKDLFHGPEGAVDIAETARLTEKVRARQVAAVRRAFVPVTHTISVVPEP